MRSTAPLPSLPIALFVTVLRTSAIPHPLGGEVGDAGSSSNRLTVLKSDQRAARCVVGSATPTGGGAASWPFAARGVGRRLHSSVKPDRLTWRGVRATAREIALECLSPAEPPTPRFTRGSRRRPRNRPRFLVALRSRALAPTYPGLAKCGAAACLARVRLRFWPLKVHLDEGQLECTPDRPVVGQSSAHACARAKSCAAMAADPDLMSLAWTPAWDAADCRGQPGSLERRRRGTIPHLPVCREAHGPLGIHAR